MEKESHQLIGKTILGLSAILFTVVLIMTLLTLLSYGERSIETNQSADDANKSVAGEVPHSTGGFRRPLLYEKEYNLMKEDKNLNAFLGSLNSLLIKESQPKVDHLSANEATNSSSTPMQSSKDEESLNLEQGWQKNSLNVGNALALHRVQEGDYESIGQVPVDYEKVREAVNDPKNYQLSKRQGVTYSDGGYYDQYLNDEKDENTFEIYDSQNGGYQGYSNAPDYSNTQGYSNGQEYSNSQDYRDGGDQVQHEVQYYLLRKEHNQVNLASQHEVRGLNELINNALSKQSYPNHPPVYVKSPPSAPHQPSSNIFVFPSSSQPATIIQPSNIVQQQQPASREHPRLPARDHHHYYPPHGENFWGWHWPKKPFKKLSMKQKVKINVCERMMRKMSPYPLRMVLPFYR